MNTEALFSYLMNVGWLLLSGWTVVLALICLVVFRHD
jgi:hypothetical protein